MNNQIEYKYEKAVFQIVHDGISLHDTDVAKQEGFRPVEFLLKRHYLATSIIVSPSGLKLLHGESIISIIFND